MLMPKETSAAGSLDGMTKPEGRSIRTLGKKAAPAPPTGVGGVRGRVQTFRALRHANFRLLWAGLVVSSLVMPMQWLVQTWLVLELTGSPLFLGLLGLARGLPMLLLGLWGGVLADRMDRRRLLIVTQCIAMALVLLLGALIITGQVQVWQVFLCAFLTAAVQSFDQPTRTALVPDLVPQEELMNAVALTAVARQSTMAVGPLGAGFLMTVIGMGPSYLLLALGNAVIVLVLLMMQLPPRSVAAVVQHSPLRNLAQGVGFVRRHPVLPGVLLTAFLPSGLGIATFSALNPVVVKEVWDGGPALMSWVFSCFGLGSLLGGFALASVGQRWPKGLLLLTSAGAVGIAMLFYAAAPWVVLALVLMVAVGIFTATAQVSSTTLVQILTPNELRGRVVSLLMVEMGLGQAGGILSGAIAKSLGPLATIALMGGILLGLCALIATALPHLRRAA